MNIRILAVAAFAFGLTASAFAVDYQDLTAKGYRWVTVDGPYACTTRQGLQRIADHRTDAIELEMVEDLEAYYLTPGTIVQVVQDDPAAGMSEIALGGITRPLWTYTKFLSTRPIVDTYGGIETPENSGLIPGSDAGVILLPPDESPAPNPTPTTSGSANPSSDR
jgi:hypothetical protein